MPLVVSNGYAVKAAFQQGAWPSVNSPAPRGLFHELAGLAMGFMFLGWLLAIPALVLTIFIDLLREPRTQSLQTRARFSRPLACAIGFALASAMNLTWMLIDPFGVFSWWFD